jgi:hypothetical protein
MAIADFSPLTTWPELVQWGQEHYRDRTFAKDSLIPTRPGLLYLVHQGRIRLSSQALGGSDTSLEKERGEGEFLLGFFGLGQPLEIPTQGAFRYEAYAHLEQTAVIWLYWNELKQWPSLYLTILEQFQQVQQRQLVWMSILGEKSTLMRLLNFLILLLRESGEKTDTECYLPYFISHAQIGSAIRSNRVTITRLMVKLREQGVIVPHANNFIMISPGKLYQTYGIRLETAP